MRITKTKVLYEDENCTVAYDFWSDGGDAGFWLRNNTEENIHLHLDKSFFIKNGVAYDYYLDRVFSASSQRGMTHSNQVGTSGSYYSSVEAQSRKEKEVVTIPPHTKRKITEYPISWMRITNCDLPGFPTRLNLRTKEFDKDNSPLVFGNRIAYSVGDDEELLLIENDFFVSEVSNYPESAMYEFRSVSYCDGPVTRGRYMRNVSPDAYYLKYSKGR